MRQDGAQSTHDVFVSASVAGALGVLGKTFLGSSNPVENEHRIEEAIQLFGKNVHARKDDKLASAWNELKATLNEPADQYDQVGQKQYPLKRMFALVYMATVNKAAYPYVGREEDKAINLKKDQALRLETLCNAIKTLHKDGKRCHWGIRNDLVGTLSKVYPGITIFPPKVDLQLAFISEYVTDYLKASTESGRAVNSLYVAWMQEGKMPKALAQELREETRLEGWLKSIEAKLRESGLTEEIGLTQSDRGAFIASLKKLVSDSSFRYCTYMVCTNPTTDALREFFYSTTGMDPQELAAKKEQLTHWATEKWDYQAENVPIRDYLLVRKILQALLEHALALSTWNQEILPDEELHTMRDICKRYAESVPSVTQGEGGGGSKEESLVLTDSDRDSLKKGYENIIAFKNDQREEYIANFFANYFLSGPNKKVDMEILVLDKNFLSKVRVDDLVIISWIENTPRGRILKLTPYRINRLLLSALATPVSKWTDLFKKKLKETLAFIARTFDKDDQRSHVLKRDSYPKRLIYLIKSLLIIQKDPGSDYAFQSMDNEFSIIIVYMNPQFIYDLAQILHLLKYLNSDQRAVFVEAIMDRLKGLDRVASCLPELISLFTFEKFFQMLSAKNYRLLDLVSTAQSFNTFFRNLLDYQELDGIFQQFRLEEVVGLVQSASDFVNVFEHLRPEQRAVIFQQFGLKKVAGFIKSALHFVNVFEHLNPEQRAAIFQQFGLKKVAGLVKSSRDFKDVFEYLNTEQRTAIFQLIQPTLLERVKNYVGVHRLSHQYLTPEECSAVRTEVLKNVPGWVKDFSNLATLLESLASTEERSRVLLKVIDLVQGWELESYSFSRTLKSLSIAERSDIFKKIESRVGPNLVERSDAFQYVLRYLSVENRSAVFKRVKDLLLGSIRDSLDFHRVLEYLSVENRSEIFRRIRDRFAELVVDSGDLRYVLEYLSDDECSVAFEMIKDRIVDWVCDVRSLRDVLRFLPSEECSKVFQMIKPRLRGFIQTVDELGFLLKELTDAQGAVVAEAFFEDIIESIKSKEQVGGDEGDILERLCRLYPDFKKRYEDYILSRDVRRVGDTSGLFSHLKVKRKTGGGGPAAEACSKRGPEAPAGGAPSRLRIEPSSGVASSGASALGLASGSGSSS
jgi:hypothetical protein